MSAGREAPVGAALFLLAAVLQLLALLGVLRGHSAVEMLVVAIAGLGFAVVHLTVVLALHLRELAAASRADADELRQAFGGGWGGA